MLETHIQDALDDGFSKLDFIKAKSKINTNPQIANNIDSVPSSDTEVTKFNDLLKSELKLRFRTDREGMVAALEGTTFTDRQHKFTDRQHKLKCMIVEEDKINLARMTLQRSESVRNIAEKVLAEEAVPCILPLEMRINEKVF
jgi:hypothetical protein